jgi:hypothetical protein
MEGRDAHAIALEDVHSAAQVHASHAASLQAAGEATFDQFAPPPSKGPYRASSASAVDSRTFRLARSARLSSSVFRDQAR